MRRTCICVVVLGMVLAIPVAGARDVPYPEADAIVRPSVAEVVSTAAPVSWNGDVRTLPVVPPWKPGDPERIIPKEGILEDVSRDEPAYTPAWQDDPDAHIFGEEIRTFGSSSFGIPLLSFNGSPYTGASPPDTNGDVSPQHFIQGVNSTGSSLVRIYEKTAGALVAGPFSMASLGGTGNCATGLGDPIVLYDQLADRWMFTERGQSNRICIYISKTSNPVVGGYWAYAFAFTEFPDYPKYAVWPDAYYMTSNESSSAVYAMDRAKMLAGLPVTLIRRSTPKLSGWGFNALTPAELDGPSAPPAGAPGIMAQHRDDEVHGPNPINPNADFIDLFEFQPDFVTPASSTFTSLGSVPVSEFDSTLCGTQGFSCFPQPGVPVRLDPIREVIMWRLAYRNFGDHETLVGNLVTDVSGTDRGGVRWFELRKIGEGAWSLYQEGTLAPDLDNRWMGSLAINKDGDIALAYNVSSAVTFPSLRYAGRQAGDPLGTLRQEAVLVAGSSSSTTNRYGDYASMSVDPSDDCTFWFTGEYHSGAGTWSTRIGALRFPSCAPAPQPVPDGFHVPGTRMTASLGAGSTIDLTWDVATCPEEQYTLYYGAIGSYGALTGAFCSIGPSGSFPGLPMPDNAFFVLAGANDAKVSSFGRTRTGGERAFTGWTTLCAEKLQDTAAACP